MIPLRFTEVDAQRAHDEWGANCGPGAIAAICGLTLDDLRPFMGDFESKRYTNPTLMWRVLGALRVSYRMVRSPKLGWPTYGLARVQWEGPWTKPGVPMRARYRYTHWVGAEYSATKAGIGVFDINCVNSGGWVALEDWSAVVVPWLLRQCHPKADGRWHLTHVVEVDRASLPALGAAS